MTHSETPPAGNPTRRWGYVRVSTSYQSTDAQRALLHGAGVPDADIFEDHGISGSTAGRSRDALSALLATVRPGDEAVVARIDRLGRRMTDVLSVVEELSERGVGLVSLADGIDSSPQGRLLLGLLCSVAEYERTLISDRVRESLAARRDAGVRLGRPAPSPEVVRSKVAAARALLAQGMSMKDAATSLNMSRATLYRWSALVDANSTHATA